MISEIITPEIYVSVLADYINGRMHGKWIDPNQSAEAIRQEINQLYITSCEPNVTTTACQDCGHIHLYEHSMCSECESTNIKIVPSAEEYVIHDHQGFGSFDVSEHSGIEELAQMAVPNDVSQTVISNRLNQAASRRNKVFFVLCAHGEAARFID